jgi:hypothetical protein
MVVVSTLSTTIIIKRIEFCLMTRRLRLCAPITLLTRKVLGFMSRIIAASTDKKYTLMGLMGPMTLESLMSLRYPRFRRVFSKVSKRRVLRSLSNLTAILLSIRTGLFMKIKIRIPRN